MVVNSGDDILSLLLLAACKGQHAPDTYYPFSPSIWNLTV